MLPPCTDSAGREANRRPVCSVSHAPIAAYCCSDSMMARRATASPAVARMEATTLLAQHATEAVRLAERIDRAEVRREPPEVADLRHRQWHVAGDARQP